LETSLQAKLLHVLQDQSFERVGESRTIKVDFRLVSATNQDLEATMADGRFRRDLFYRLNTFSIHIPPLRERKEDIPLLVNRLTTAQASKTHQPEPVYSSPCIETMSQYHWPGNVRELKNLVKRLVIMRPGEVINVREIEGLLKEPGPGDASGFLPLAEMEKRHIKNALDLSGGVVGGAGGAAALLGIPRQTLQYRMKKHGLIAN
jgi:DNA-binding NtrC family response regulator